MWWTPFDCFDCTLLKGRKVTWSPGMGPTRHFQISLLAGATVSKANCTPASKSGGASGLGGPASKTGPASGTITGESSPQAEKQRRERRSPAPRVLIGEARKHEAGGAGKRHGSDV